MSGPARPDPSRPLTAEGRSGSTAFFIGSVINRRAVILAPVLVGGVDVSAVRSFLRRDGKVPEALITAAEKVQPVLLQLLVSR